MSRRGPPDIHQITFDPQDPDEPASHPLRLNGFFHMAAHLLELGVLPILEDIMDKLVSEDAQHAMDCVIEHLENFRAYVEKWEERLTPEFREEHDIPADMPAMEWLVTVAERRMVQATVLIHIHQAQENQEKEDALEAFHALPPEELN